MIQLSSDNNWKIFVVHKSMIDIVHIGTCWDTVRKRLYMTGIRYKRRCGGLVMGMANPSGLTTSIVGQRILDTGLPSCLPPPRLPAPACGHTPRCPRPLVTWMFKILSARPMWRLWDCEESISRHIWAGRGPRSQSLGWHGSGAAGSTHQYVPSSVSVWVTCLLLQQTKLSAACDWLNWLPWDPIDQSQAADSLVCYSSRNVAQTLSFVCLPWLGKY